MASSDRVIDQVRRNLVALISLVVAVSSLSYTTWRNERTEANRNTRYAGFEVMMQASRLREILYHLRYDPEPGNEGAVRSGWVTVLAIDDLSRLLEPPVPGSAAALHDAWAGNWPTIGKEESKSQVEAALDRLQDDTLALLRGLD